MFMAGVSIQQVKGAGGVCAPYRALSAEAPQCCSIKFSAV